jgi:hypothetical protein
VPVALVVSKFISMMCRPGPLQLIDDLDEIAHGPSYSVQLGDHQHIAIAKVADGCLELLALGQLVAAQRAPPAYMIPRGGRPNLLHIATRPSGAQSPQSNPCRSGFVVSDTISEPLFTE